MSISRKFQRSKSKYTLSQKIISAVTAAGFIMQPIVGFAQAITKADDAFKNTIINKGNGVTDIWADRVVGNSAVNVFKDFQLDANNIANMYFNELNRKEADASNLVNFVNSRIDINGTVNAIQNSQIGGNLFFLSQDGMAVGKSGVINTGSLYVMTPTQDYIKNMKVVAGTADAATAEKELNAITNITKDANAWQAIPVNASGTITVLGKVNATNEVQMRAAKIGVGKNVDDQVVDEVASGDTVSAASITTGVTNFGDLVNIKGVDGAEDVKSGLTGELTATQTGSGDIVLSAYVDGANKTNELGELPVVGTTLETIGATIENTFEEQEFDASVDVYGTVETTGQEGAININATAINSNADYDETIKDYKLNNNNNVAQLAKVKADVNIGGTVKAVDDVTVKAEAVNRYIDNSGAFGTALKLAVSSGTPLAGDAAYSVLDTEANVNVTSDGSIESTAGNVDIDAKAETLAASAASTLGLKFKTAGGTTGANVPAVAVVYTDVDNKANVTVAGNVKAAQNISIDADADMKVEAENKMSLMGKEANQFVIGVTVANADNGAEVIINGTGNEIAAGNDLNVNADAASDFTSRTSIKAPEASAMAVAVNVAEFNSNANVNIDTDLSAGNDLNVKADNIITDDNVNAESTIGSGKYMSAASQIVTGHVEQKKGEVKEWIGTLAGKISAKLQEKLSGSDDADIPKLQLSEIFKAGATVNYSGQTHGSNVTIGENSTLNAGKKMDIEALTKIEDAHITATGTTASYNDAYPAEATLNAAVLVNNMDNSSSVVIKDAVTDEQGTEHKATLSAVNGVDINASTRFEYNRIANMIQEVKDAAAQIKNAVSGLDGAIKSDFDAFLGNLDTQIDTWESAFATADETFATSDSGVLAIGEAATAGLQVLTALNNLNTMLDGNEGGQVAADVKATIQGASDILTGALAFADPNSYGNFAAASASKGSSGDTDAIAGHHPSAINGAGTVMVNNVDSVSTVEVGSNSVIASNGKVNLNAENYMKDVSLGGLNTVPLTNSGGGTAASIGATVNYSDFNTDTIVAVNDGANISGGDINIAGSNEIDHVSVAGGAGMGPSDETGSNGIVLNGMISLVNGSSDILTVVDDGARLTAGTEPGEDESGSTEETKTGAGNISISGHNDTNIVNVAAGLNLGSGSGAIGMGLAYNDFAVKNIAGVTDISEQIKALYTIEEHYTDENGEDAVRYVIDKVSNDYTNPKADDGSISAYGFNVDAATEGSIQSVSVAASASKNDDTGETSFFGRIKGGIRKLENSLLGDGGKLDTVTGNIFGTESGKANNFFNMGKNTHGGNGGIKINNESSGKGGFMPSFSIAGSGSVSMNMLDNATQAIVDNAKITMNGKGDVNVTARDTAYAGAYSGAAALQWKSGGSASDKSVGFSGAAGVNDITNKVNAVIKNTAITNAGELNTMALSGGEQLALGLGLNVVKSGNTSGYSGNAAVSVNLIDHDVEALHENNTVLNTNDVNVAAYARDIENTGGGSLGAGQQKVGVGATVGVAMLNNTISAGIKGGEYKYVGNVDVEALNALQNITVGIAAGLTIPSDGNAASANVEGAGVYNEVHNTTNAFIEGNDTNNKVGIETVDGGEVSVIAQDVAINNDYEKVLTNELTDGKEEIAKRMGKNFEITGKNELAGVEMGDAETELNKNKADNKKEETVDIYKLDEEGKTTGSSIITVAGGLAATTGKGAGGAAVAITDIENTYTADVKYADITADELDVDAGSNSNIVTVAGGIAAANKGSGVGSVSWNDVINTANVNIANSDIHAQQTTATAANQAQIVSVGGQISGAGKAAVGATLSYVGLDNTTKVNISTTDFDELTDGGTSVTAEAKNTSDSYNIGAGVSAGGTASVSGTVVVTQTKGTAGAVMDAVEINNAKKVTASAVDDTDILSVIGGINIGGKVAAGAGVSYTEIGDVSTNPDNGQYVTAEINNSTINADGAGSTVEVKAKDEARVINVAIGVGGAGNVAVQGASATTLINKTTSAEITDTNIDEKGGTSADVTVDAQNDSEITSSADVAAAAGSGAGVGAGIAVNRIIQQTNAAVNGGNMNVNNLTVKANATPQITNIGVGIGVAGSGAGVTGSVAVNMIENDVTAHIGSGENSSANIVADGTIGVVATSDEQIATYAGSASVAGSGAAVGLSVSYNELTGTTTATIDGDTTSVSASGNGDALEVKDTVGNEKDDKILDNVVDKTTFDSQNTLGDDRVESKYKGVAVSASSTHAIKSFIINGGVAGTGAAVNGTVNVNQIGGSTKAAITGADINTAGTASDVNVIAHDYTNSAGMVGTASIAGTGAGVGLGSDTNTVSREVTAEVSGKDGNNKNTINAAGFNVEAEAKQGISSLTVSAAGAGIGAGVSNATSVALLNGKTTAKVNNANITASSMNVTANHTGKLNTMGTVLGAGGLGAGVGVGVSVLNEDSITTADVSSSDITINNAESSDNNINITAANTTKVNYQLYSVGGALAGVAGAIGVSNVNSKVNTNVANVAMNGSEADDINIGAENTIDFTNTSGSGAGGAVGVGVGVAVNTIDSRVTTTVDDAELNAANDINVTANETRKVKQEAVNAGAGAVAGGANVMITNVGSAVADSYGSGLQTDDNGKVEDGSGINTNTIFDEANKAVAGNKLKDDYTYGVKVNDVPEVTAEKGADNASVVEVKINNSNLNAGNKVTAEAVADTNVTMDAVQASGGAYISASGTVGILDVNRNSVVNISNNTKITAQDLAVSTTQKGASELDIYQGNVGGKASIGAAYGSASSSGVNNISVKDSEFDIGGKVDINANDESKTAVNAIGVTLAGGGAASVIVAQGSNDSSTNINVNDTDINAGEDIDIHAERQAKDEKGNKVDSLSVSAKAASGGLMFASAGVAATADELGKVGVTVMGGSNFTAGKVINITALNAPSVSATTGSLSASMVASGAITVAEANIGKHIEPEDKENENKEDNGHLKTFVNITEGNSFTAKSLTAEARADAAQNVKMEGLSLSASLLPNGALQANTGGAEVYSDVEVNVANNVFKGSDTEAAANGIDLDISGVNSVDQKVNASGISVSTVFASGTNIADSSAQLSTQVQVDGPSEDSEINNVDLNASSYAKVDTDANGYGGAIADVSPYAAKVNNNYTADTDVKIGGDWNTAGSFTAQAVNGMDIDLVSDAVRAAVIGGSGTWLANTINNAANVTVDGATITTGGAQNYTAQNTVDYNGTINGSGYGGINVNATDYSDDIDFSAGVDIKESTLHGAGDGGSITAFANTQGNITTKNSLKSAGVIPVALAFSDHAIDYDNRVNVVNSDLTTDKADADITLAATDDTDVELETIADTQGGVAGAASAEASNAFNRGNKINIDADSDLLSTKDINLYAGADANGTKSSLNLQVLADAYNKTAIPVYTDPTVNNSMTQSNQIELAGNAESVRHINASAAKGFTTVTESAKEYKVWTGTGGEGNVASTALGDQIKNETADNYINVTGTAKAGVHNKLDITIDGHSSTAAQPTYEERPLIGSDGKPVLDDEGNPVMEEVLVDKGDVSYKDVIITVDDGEETDWFNKNQITPDNLVVVNGLMERYNQVMEYLAAYAEGSEAYEAYEKEKNLLLTEMLKAGLAERDGNNNIVPLDYIDVPAISLPDIVVSGGNINLETDTLKGSGEITAQGAPQISITNNSDLYLKVQDVTISDNGGNVYLTGNKTFTGKWQEDGTSANTPTITIHGGSGDESQFTQYGNQHPQADIGIFGDITNTAGDVKIINDNYSILVDGNVSGRNIQITATRGNVTQQSSSGVLNVGNDPITKLQFSEAVAEKIQKYLHSLKQDGSKEFKDYTAYLDWLINTVGITLSELGYAGDVNNITGYTKTWNEVLSAVAQKEGLSNTAANTFMEEKKTEGFNAYVSYLNELGIGYKYNAATLNATISEESAGILAGGNIYIDAVNVNIGGLIQSGYGAYSTKLTADDNAKVEDLDKEWQANKVVLTDNDVLGNSKYLINGGGEVYNTDTHVWDYEVKVYYNPSTGQLITESVRPEGGNIQISGKVSSTGGGRIMAMDGTSNVNINTAAVDKDVKVNSITVNDITGLISITDKNVTEDSAGKKVDGWVTEYKNGQWREYAYGTDASSIAWQTGVKDAYKPVEGTQFAWTGGASGEVIREKHYTEDFLFWGALSYNTSEALLDHLEQIGVDVEGTVISSGSSEDPTPMKDGSLITDGYKGGGNMFRIDWTYTNPQNQEEVKATDPTVKKKYDGVAGKIFGYGEYTYTWTETTGDQMASTTGIKADNTIQIGFLGNGEGNGDITVNSGKDMLLNGNISNATVVNDNNDFEGRGSVNLTSDSGSVCAIGSANINSDYVNIKAATGVNVNHAAIGDSASINIATNSGDIKFVSSGGDLNIEQAVTGGNTIDATTGSVYLEAQGDILDAATGSYAVKGQRIDLISNTGNIGALNDDGTVANAFRVLGGSELYSSDTMASSVNAQAEGDIVLTQADGNMRLGTIVSENGDAVLTVNNGSFVDAHPSENSDSSSAQDKIDRWVEAGLIVEGADADSSEESAKLAKEEREAALNARADALANGDETKKQSYKEAAEMLAGAFADAENNKELQTAKDTYINEYQAAVAAYNEKIAGVTDQEQIDQINNDYKEIYDGITNKYLEAQAKVYGSEFTADEQQLISSYAEVSHSDNYGWSQNQLLYAIQDSVLNAEPGEVQTVETPNVTANNITLNAANGGVGIDGAAEVIGYDKLNDEATLKLLAQAKAGDLTWDEKNQQVTIRQQQAITISVNEQDGTYGKVNVTGKDNVYLAGVKDTELNINGVTTDGDIRLQGDKGVNVDGMLTGEDLTIAGGTGNIMGTGSDKYVNTNISGDVDAKAEGSIYISQNGDLNVLAIAAGGLADLKATNNILMSDVEGSTAQGYINAQTLNLAAGGNIGTDAINTNALRILNNGVVVNAKANKENGDIILAGVTGTGLDGELVLGAIEGANLDVTSAGNVSIGKDASEGETAVEGSIDVNGDASISAEDGSVTQTADSNITANAVNASATENILLNSKENKVNSFVVNGLGADNSLNGSVNIVSTAHNAENTVKVDFGKVVGEETVGLTVNGTVDVTSTGTSGLNISGGSLTTSGNNAGNVTFTSAGSITAGTSVNSAADIVMDAKGVVTNTGSLTARNNIDVTTTTGKIDLGGNVEAETGLVNVTTGSGSITTTGNVSGHKDVTLESVDGNITVGGYTESEVKNVTANVKGDGNIEFTGEVSASGNVQAEVTGEGDISTGSSASVSGTDITFTTNDGSITTGSNLTADANVNLNTNTGDIILGGDTTANNGNITININKEGSLKDAANTDNTLSAFSPDNDASKGNIYINLKGIGDVDLSEIYADNDARVDVADGNLTLGTINGQLVAIQLRTQDREMNVGEIIAGTQIVLTGSDMTLDEISQRPDADGMLVITPDNAEADKPIDNFTIGDIKTNSDSGIRFDRLWVNNSDIHISEGQLWFDKLYVEDNAHFSNDEMSAAIYGKPPLRDGSDSVYWINTEKNRPESSLDMWLNGTGDWMYLRFTDDHIQESNGILLTLDEYDYVYDQRFTAENHLRWQHGRYLDEDWKQAYGYGLSMHNRYGLIDYQEFTETNAGADEVAVEA